MIDEGAASAIVDDIVSKIEKLKWVKSYEVYFHSLEQNSVQHFSKTVSYRHLDSAGVALRLVTSTNAMIFAAASLQQLPLLMTNLSSPPKLLPTRPIQFHPLTKSFKRLPLLDFFKVAEIDSLNSLLKTLFPSNLNYRFISQKEIRIITNMGSPVLYEDNVRNTFEMVVYPESKSDVGLYDTVPFIYGEHYFLRLLDKRIKSYLLVPSKIATLSHVDSTYVVLGPKLVAKMILEALKSEPGKQIFPHDVYAYENPHAPFHLFSSVYDDEGMLTQPKELVAGGAMVSPSLFLPDNQIQLGQNGFRYNQFGEVSRKYDFPPRFYYTNIFVEGGSGSALEFFQRQQKTILLEDGNVVYTDNAFHVLVRQGIVYAEESPKAVVPHFNLTIPIKVLVEHGELTGDRVVSLIKQHFSSVECGFLGIRSHLLNIAS